MRSSTRIIVNTFAQYIRTIISMILSLYTIRIVLSSLGESDFGVYTVIAGVVSMMSFITSSLIGSTQRFVSYYQGKGEIDEQKKVFSNSLAIHLVLGFLLFLFLLLCTSFVFKHLLEIPTERLYAAKIVYISVAFILLTTFITSPYKALLVSHENIVYISIIEISDAVIKVLLVILMSKSQGDRLILYGIIMLSLQFVNLIAFYLYSKLKYVECVGVKKEYIDKELVRKIMSFTGWNIYGTGCQIGQREGIAIILNNFYNSATNAAYGLGFQVAGYTSFLATAITTAIRPQITKSEGSGDRSKALGLSIINSKLVFFLMTMLCIPCLFEINTILALWLKDVPQDTALFCVMAMLTIVADSFTIGFTTLNSAIGNIKWYTIIMNTPKLLTFPIAYGLLKYGYGLESIVVTQITTELLMALVRVPVISKDIGLNVKSFFYQMFTRELIPFLVNVLICYLISQFVHSHYRFILTFCLSITSYTIVIYLIGLTKEEKTFVKSIINRIRKNENSNHGL